MIRQKEILSNLIIKERTFVTEFKTKNTKSTRERIRLGKVKLSKKLK